ncbi:glycosyltransferase family 4 protein [uncultured Brevundimonas sp.]|uniref:glycosyltransferase family 4 protein n=1 Tax=uncultured Brevundimonas sp. TaxID=213418 RepID=UPI002604E4F0|nr:glycosyltransferase family 4 protein [uncultured Brevundimonas sp.]
MSMRPRHVLMTTDAVGGVWTYALDLAEGLLARGVGVTLAVLGPAPGPAHRQAARQVEGLALVEVGRSLDWLADHPEQLDEAERALRGLVARTGADLVHLNAPALGGEDDWGAPVVGVCHSCVATWWDAVRGTGLPQDFEWRTSRLAAGYRGCDRLIAPSLAFAQATAARYGVQPVVIHNGRRPAALHAPERRRMVLTSGRLWDEGKNIAVLERAAVRMRGAVEAAGPLDGPNGQTVRLAKTRALGPLSGEALRRRLTETSVFCAPALYEPFGLGVLEAAQAGCALVLSDIPTFRELWEGAALFVQPRDDVALAAVLDELLDDADRARRLGRLASERAGRFSVDAMVEGTLEVYADVLALRAPLGEAAA